MATRFLACTVRRCGLPLARQDRVWTCPAGHAFDVARGGYVNLLQPQDRRSLSAGDSKAAVEARAALLAAGVGRTILGRIVERAAALDLGGDPVVVDLGSGSGDALGALAGARRMAGAGIDLSTAAAGHAARRFPSLTWVVANADRRLPLVDRSVRLMLSLHGRRNPAECARAIAPGGFLLAAVPAPDDLAELRELVQGSRIDRDRSAAVVAEHAPAFTLRERLSARERPALDRESLLNLLRATYRGGRRSVSGPVHALDTLDVTLASDVLIFERRPGTVRPGERQHTPSRYLPG